MASNDTKLKAISEKQTKAAIIATMAEDTGLSRPQVKSVMNALANTARRHLMKRGSGEFVVPELAVKIRRVEKPATKARKGRNPLTGEEIMIKPKPARKGINVRALKALKEVLA
ncbi:MAG: HU family DNA-binding protein [Gammaproteobacteria bacterium]